MTELLTAAQMRAIEQAAIESGEVTGLELMERAGQGVVDAVFEEWPELAGDAAVAEGSDAYLEREEAGDARVRRAVVLCGPGNNGGDGFVVARRLHERGWAVEGYLYGDPEKLPPDARVNYERWGRLGEVQSLTAEAAGKGDRPILMVDAMFGTGLSRAIPLDLALAHHAVRNRDTRRLHPGRRCHVVAVDCSSGFDADSGSFLLPPPPQERGDNELKPEVWRDWFVNDASKRLLPVDMTVSFHRLKVGHSLNESSGKLRVIDIGLGKEDRHPAHLMMPAKPETIRLLNADWGPDRKDARMWPGRPLQKRSGHKYAHGHALILSGAAGHTGAARLAARGALRIGAGLVTLGVPGAAQMEVAAQVTAIMLRRVDDGAALFEVLADERLNALCIGPGLGLDDRAVGLVVAALEAERPTVLDADALTLLAGEEALFSKLHPKCILTPHAGEFARLFPDIAEKLDAPATKGPAYSKVDATREAAARAGCVVLFKGPDTVIADPEGRCSINAAFYERSAPWLATAGSGDVLAGFIAGLMARGFDPMQAAETAAWLHVECALKFGPGLIAEDIPEQLPQVFRDLGL